MLERIKSLLLRLALGAYNGAILLIINPLMGAYGLWSERRWTTAMGIREISEAATPDPKAAGTTAVLPSAPSRS